MLERWYSRVIFMVQVNVFPPMFKRMIAPAALRATTADLLAATFEGVVQAGTRPLVGYAGESHTGAQAPDEMSADTP
jgi:hypothetical protein